VRCRGGGRAVRVGDDSRDRVGPRRWRRPVELIGVRCVHADRDAVGEELDLRHRRSGRGGVRLHGQRRRREVERAVRGRGHADRRRATAS